MLIWFSFMPSSHHFIYVPMSNPNIALTHKVVPWLTLSQPCFIPTFPAVFHTRRPSSRWNVHLSACAQCLVIHSIIRRVQSSTTLLFWSTSWSACACNLHLLVYIHHFSKVHPTSTICGRSSHLGPQLCDTIRTLQHINSASQISNLTSSYPCTFRTFPIVNVSSMLRVRRPSNWLHGH